jgi:hypothetical protein
MTDFSQCPSCSAPAEVCKNGSVRFSHYPVCSMGRLERISQGGLMTNPPSPYSDARKCALCGTVVEPGVFATTTPGEWKATSECPICWAIEEAKLP